METLLQFCGALLQERRGELQFVGDGVCLKRPSLKAGEEVRGIQGPEGPCSLRSFARIESAVCCGRFSELYSPFCEL